MRVIYVALVALVLSACAQGQQNKSAAAPKHNAAELAANADFGLAANATLAGLGSFEWDIAPLVNKAATQLELVARDYKANRITRDAGQARVDKIDGAHDLLVKSQDTCQQNPATGKCRGSEARARALLDQGRTLLEGVDRDRAADLAPK